MERVSNVSAVMSAELPLKILMFQCLKYHPAKYPGWDISERELLSYMSVSTSVSSGDSDQNESYTKQWKQSLWHGLSHFLYLCQRVLVSEISQICFRGYISHTEQGGHELFEPTHHITHLIIGMTILWASLQTIICSVTHRDTQQPSSPLARYICSSALIKVLMGQKIEEQWRQSVHIDTMTTPLSLNRTSVV